MKKLLLASLIAAGAIMFPSTISQVKAFSTPVLDMNNFVCRTGNPAVVDAQISFTRSTVHPGSSITILRGSTVVADRVSLPETHTGVLNFGFGGHEIGDDYVIIYHNDPKVSGMYLGFFEPTNCESPTK